MQHFKNTADGTPFAFDDDVVVSVESGVYSFATAAGIPLTKLPTTLQPSDPPSDPVPLPPSIDYIPAWLVRERLETANLWDAAVAAMSTAQQLKFCSLQIGIDPADKTVIKLLTKVGTDPAVILAAQ